MFQHEKYDMSKMREYFYTKSWSLVYRTTVQKCVALCCIYSTYARLTETQTLGTNFATAQKVDVIKVSSIERTVPPLLRRQCDVIILLKFMMLMNVLIFQLVIHYHDFPNETVRKSVLRFCKRLAACIKAEGGHFKQSLN